MARPHRLSVTRAHLRTFPRPECGALAGRHKSFTSCYPSGPWVIRAPGRCVGVTRHIAALGGGHPMPFDKRFAYRSRAAELGEFDIFGLGAEWGERIATGVVVAVAVMIVALIAVVMGMV